MSSFAPGDVEINRFSLGGLDLRAKLRDFSVFESILKPYTLLETTIFDNSDIINESPVSKTLSVSFNQPGQVPYEGDFVVLSLERVATMENQRTAMYTLSAYSTHMTRFPRVQRAYREMTATSIVEDIVVTFLNPIRPVVVRDPSRGVLGNQHMPYNVNGVQVHKAIRAVLERAVGSLGSSYMFFENNRNMVVDTLENMLGNALSSPVATYYRRPLGSDFLRDQVLQNFTILSMREDARRDATNLIQTQNSVSNPFDIFSANSSQTVAGEKNLVSTSLNILYNIMRPPTFLSQALPQRLSSAGRMDSQGATIHVPLNPALTVGSGFGIEVLSPLGDTDSPVVDPVSGSLLATEVRHTVDLMSRAIRGTTTVRGTRGGVE